MARLRLEIDIPGYTVKELQELIAAIDESESEPDEGIAPEHVEAQDVFMMIYSGSLPFMEGKIAEAVLKGLREQMGVEAPKQPIPQLQYYEIVQDKMWDPGAQPLKESH